MVNLKSIILVFTILILSGYRIDDNSILDVIFSTYHKSLGKGNYTILVNVNSGCPNCIKAVDEFIIKYSNKPNYYFILPFTTYKSMKIRYTGTVLTKRNLIIDEKNLCIKYDLVKEQPTIFYVKNGYISKKIQLSPDNVNRYLRLLINEK